MRRFLPYITKPILILSIVSLFTDFASEMLYPIMPLYLKSIGFSIALIAILEGFAEMIAGLSKGYFGELSDVKQKRLPFVRLGYLLSAISKPMMAVFTYPVWIFFARTTDRIGKGLRSAPRDALLSAQSAIKNKAKVFGFHRAMDTFGAVAGPACALAYLFFYPGEYKMLFLIAFIPGLTGVLLTFTIHEKQDTPLVHPKVHFISFLNSLQVASPDYKKLLAGLLIFALVNSTDILLLIKMKEEGVDDLSIIRTYIFYNLSFALFSFPAGVLADHWGIKKTFITGLLLFSIVYAGFALLVDKSAFFILFLIYGMYAACTEGIAKAWISNITHPTKTGTAIGTYSALASISTFIASSTAGILWLYFGPEYAFGVTAAIGFLLVFYFLKIPYKAADINS
jgi:MFS family permease